MISWECSKAENTAEKKSRRRRRSKRERESQSLEEKDEKDGEENAGSCNEESSSGESEYHSAEDELVNSESESPCLSVFASGSDDESSVSTSSFGTCSNYGWDIPGDDMILDGNFQLKSIVSKRAPSKKQKQKRREEQQKTFFLGDLPFANLQEYDFLGDEISDSVTVQKSVPSLADLCIRATRNLNSATRNLIPRSLNASMSHANEKFYMEKLQLSWLCQILEKVTYREEKSLNISLLTFSYFNKLEEKKFFIPTRNVWTIHFIHQRKSACSFNRDRYGLADIKSFFLPFTHALNYAFLRHFHYDNVTNSSVTSILSALATVVDLMLPQTVNLPSEISRRRNESGEQELIAQKTAMAFNRIKADLKARYPKIIELCWDRIVPYVFWARGDVYHATQAFRMLIYAENRVRFKAMYLYEIGRLHNMFNDQSMAQDCIRECTECLFKKPKYNEEVIRRQLEHQSKLLKANLCDQGVMNAFKARQAHSAWMTCLQTPKDRTFQSLDHYFVMDSFFCFHSGTWEDPTKTWLDEALSKLQAMCSDYPGLLFYQSMVYALQGKEKEAESAYKDFFRRSTDDDLLPGQYISEEKPNTKSAWQDLAQTVKLQGTSPLPLKVLWRTQLSPPRLYNRGFSLIGEKECGSLILNHIPGEMVTWKSLEPLCPRTWNDRTALEEIDPPCIPHMTELYSDNVGNTVSLLWANSHKNYQKEAAQINVFYSKDMLKERSAIMKQSYDEGWTLPPAGKYDTIHSFLESKYKLTKHNRRKMVRSRVKAQFKGTPFIFVFEKQPLVFGKTILLFIKLDQRHFAMFINCESRRDFLEYSLVTSDSIVKSQLPVIPRQVWSKAHNMFTLHGTSYVVYDRYGQQLDAVDCSVVEDKVTPLVLKDRFFYIQKGTGFLNSSCNRNTSEISMYGIIRCFRELGEMLVLLTINSIVFMEAASSLLIPVVVKSISPLSIPIVDGSLHFQQKFNKFEVLGEKTFEESPTKRFMRAALAIDNHVVILKTDVNTFERDVKDLDPVTVTASLAIPGQAQEVCFLSEQGGFLASVSQYKKKKSQFYRENLYHYAHSGQLLGVLVNLGPGPQSFLPQFYTREGLESQGGAGLPGWQVYMRDGHDGIICVRLKL